MSLRKNITSILDLPIKRIKNSISIGNDICHIPRIVDILTYTSAKRRSAAIQNSSAQLEPTEHEDGGVLRHHQVVRDKARAARFASRLLRGEELDGFAKRLDGAIEGYVRSKEERRGVERVRSRIGAMGGLKEVGKMEFVDGGGGEIWREMLEAGRGDSMGNKKQESTEMALVKLLEAVMVWKIRAQAPLLGTPWGIFAREVERGKGSEVGIGAALKELKRRRRESLGGSDIKPSMISPEQSIGERIDEESPTALAGKGTSAVVKPDSLLGQGGFKDDIVAFLAVEERVRLRVKKADNEIWGCARFLAGRYVISSLHAVFSLHAAIVIRMTTNVLHTAYPFHHRDTFASVFHTDILTIRLAAKEALQKAFSSLNRRLTFHDIAILSTPATKDGSQAPRVLVLDEDGQEARECKVSISHDGEYASAFALVENVGSAREEAVRSVSRGRQVTKALRIVKMVSPGREKSARQQRTKREDGASQGDEASDNKSDDTSANLGMEDKHANFRLRYYPTNAPTPEETQHGILESAGTPQELRIRHIDLKPANDKAKNDTDKKNEEKNLPKPDFFW